MLIMDGNMLNLDQILKDAEEFAKIRDAATPGPWTVSDDCPCHVATNYEIGFGLPALIANVYSKHGDDNSTEAISNATFIAAANNYDSPAIIRMLVERIRQLEKVVHVVKETPDITIKVYDRGKCDKCGSPLLEIKEAPCPGSK